LQQKSAVMKITTIRSSAFIGLLLAAQCVLADGAAMSPTEPLLIASAATYVGTPAAAVSVMPAMDAALREQQLYASSSVRVHAMGPAAQDARPEANVHDGSPNWPRNILAGLVLMGLVGLAAANSRKPERDLIAFEHPKT
jgi:hypothetical protein